MATYTIELRKVADIYSREEVESWFQDYKLEDYLLPEQLEQMSKYNIWSKERLAKKIVNHYWMREIGFETPALFKLYAKNTMEEIMQEKLPLIYTMFLNYDPLINVDYTETFKRTAEGTAQTNGHSNSNSASNTEGMNISNDTPQTNVNRQDIETGVFASNINQADTSSTISDITDTNNNSTNNTVEEYSRNFKGNQGISATYQRMIQLFRENVMAIDKDIIKELNGLFMGLY